MKPGDHMSTSITKGVGTSWTISIKNDTTGQSFATTQTHAGPQTSAEWIEEAPAVGGRVATLGDYGLTTFDLGTVNGVSPQLTAAESGVMVQRKGQVSTPIQSRRRRGRVERTVRLDCTGTTCEVTHRWGA